MDAGPRQLCTGQLTDRPWRKVRVGEGVNEQEAPSVRARSGFWRAPATRPTRPATRSHAHATGTSGPQVTRERGGGLRCELDWSIHLLVRRR